MSVRRYCSIYAGQKLKPLKESYSEIETTNVKELKETSLSISYDVLIIVPVRKLKIQFEMLVQCYKISGWRVGKSKFRICNLHRTEGHTDEADCEVTKIFPCVKENVSLLKEIVCPFSSMLCGCVNTNAPTYITYKKKWEARIGVTDEHIGQSSGYDGSRFNCDQYMS